jgi:acetate kinase
MTAVLVLNVGSSSVKYQLFDMPSETVIAQGHKDRIGVPGSDYPSHTEALAEIVSELPGDVAIDIVGHRVVHGGGVFTEPTVITGDVIRTLEDVSSLAPLHNPPNIAGIRAAQNALPEATHVAVFDTAFFRDLPPEAFTYALPKDLRERYGIRKYGFHGTSHEYVSQTLQAVSSEAPSKVITCHLGNGSSMAAIVDGVAIDTTLGFTPLPGLVMGTRSGDIDPAIVTHLLREGMSIDDVDTALGKEGGLMGLAGSSDMRDIIARAEAGDEDCELALRVWAGRIRHYIGAYWALMGGLDALVFTGGIGENSAVLRARVVDLVAPLGIVVDGEANNSVSEKAVKISSEASQVAVWVIATNEELQIARHSHLLVGGGR